MSQLFASGGQSFGVSASTSVLQHQTRPPDLPLEKSPLAGDGQEPWHDAVHGVTESDVTE